MIKQYLLLYLIATGPLLVAQSFLESSISTSFEGVDRSSVAFADIDNDGDEDLLITGNTGTAQVAKLYKNDGFGYFVELTETPLQGVSSGSISFSDIDGDNDQDVLITGLSSAGRISNLYENDGLGNFSEVLNTPFQAVSFSAVEFADIDNDNDQDVLITGNDGSMDIAILYENDGLGSFSEVESTPFEGVSVSCVKFADVDGDNDQDLLIVGFNGSSSSSRLYINDGNGGYSENENTSIEDVEGIESSVAFADIDNDNDQDLLVTGANGLEVITKLYLNDGTGVFDEVDDTPFLDTYGGSVAFADTDGDGDQDVIISGNTEIGRIAKLYSNNGSGEFSEVLGTPFQGVTLGSVVFADVDGDSDQDVLIAGWPDGVRSTRLYINQQVVSLQELTNNNLDEIRLFPNPVLDDYLTLDIDSPIAGSATMSIISLDGRILRSKRVEVYLGVQLINVDVSFLRKGSYIVEMKMKGSKLVSQVQVQ
ncbi:FG-GAP-like repeat-containing protein [Lewinella cohaerens]|uniref:FG-GAP-like repeat-containing protein n=1 Tax=Lewinella cohaerens TaxID=70995 RepID=UPI00035D7175|nr:FG-GAP-like repeat-containing protein [Lewinella cohaerens]